MRKTLRFRATYIGAYHIRTYQKLFIAISKSWCTILRISHDLCTKCGGNAGSLTLAVGFNGSGHAKRTSSYELSWPINRHTNLQGLALLASLMLKYLDDYPEMNDRFRNEKREDEIVISFIDNLKSLKALEMQTLGRFSDRNSSIRG